ncbi:MAG: phosphotransferase, partial [Myxococcota bacterium]
TSSNSTTPRGIIMSNSTEHPWDADRPLDAQRVALLLKAAAPELAHTPIRWLGEGWDNEVYGVGDWIFRFPKRASVVHLQQQESQTMTLLAEQLPVAVPVFEIFGDPGPFFPYPFVGYRRVPGVPMNQTMPPPSARPMLVAALAEVLDRFIALSDTPLIQELDIQTYDPQQVRQRVLTEKLEEVIPVLGEETVERWRSYCRDASIPEPWQGKPVYLHNDLCSDHLLLDPECWDLVGIIDFADQCLGDPVSDLMGLAAIFGLDFAFEVAESMTALTLSAADRARLVDQTALFPMEWASHAAVRGEPHVTAHYSTIVEQALRWTP